jgi:hypothetical protein
MDPTIAPLSIVEGSLDLPADFYKELAKAYNQDIVNGAKFSKDYSNYAKNRLKAWLIAEYDLLHKTIGPIGPNGFINTSNFIKRTLPQYDLGLISFAGSIGFHRDAGYCYQMAAVINLQGNTTFKIIDDATNLVYTYNLGPKSSLIFNPKKPHSTENSSADRISLNLWHARPEYREQILKLTQ